jgi:hypothetical protein
MRRQLHAGWRYCDSDWNGGITTDRGDQWPTTIHSYRNRDVDIYCELVYLSSSYKYYGYESNTGKLRAANRLWNDKLDRALRGAADAAPQRFCGCSAEYGEYEYIRAKLCFSWNWSAGFH